VNRDEHITHLAESAVLAYLSGQALIIPLEVSLLLDDLSEDEWVAAVNDAAERAGIDSPGDMEIHVGIALDEHTVRMMDVDGNAVLIDLASDDVTWEDPAA
jgi:1,2-phenylacetyl-CoA epoxidase catalytic subunit